MKCEKYRKLMGLQVEGDLPESQALELESHLRGCAECRVFLEDLKESQWALKLLAAEEPGDEQARERARATVMTHIEAVPGPERRRNMRPFWIAAAAAVVATATLAAVHVFSPRVQRVDQISKVRPPVLEQQEHMESSRPLQHPGTVRTKPTSTTRLEDSLSASSPRVRNLQPSEIPEDVGNLGYVGGERGGEGNVEGRVTPGSAGSVAGGLPFRYAQAQPPLAVPAETPPRNLVVTGETPAVDTRAAWEGNKLQEQAKRQIANADELRIYVDDRKRDTSGRIRWDQVPVTQGCLRAQTAEGETIGEFPLKHTEVKAEISGYLAQTIVEQQYTNPYKDVIEAVYVFPLPGMAAVNDFVMEVGDRKIVGIVRPRAEAERIYQEAKARGQTASLLTQERPNIFTQNVANIEPGGQVNIRITYFERLSYEHGYYEYVFPMVVGPRYIPGNTAAPNPSTTSTSGGGGWAPATDRVPDADRITPPVLRPDQRSGHDIDLSVQLNAGLPIRDLQCPTHRIKVSEDGDRVRTVRLAKSDRIPNRDFVLRWSVAGRQTDFGFLATRGARGGFFTLMMQPPLDPTDSQVTPREITFIMDVSGSMSGIPIETSKNVVRRTLSRLRPEDLFNIFIFASGNGQLWESPQPGTAENLHRARNYLNTLQGGGGTEMLSGVSRALHARHDPKYLQMYAFLTDGYVGNEAEILRLIKEDKGEARFFAFGIGSSVNRYLIDGIGEFGNGSSMVVLPREKNQAQHAADKFLEAIESPVLVDIDVDWGGLPVYDVYPQKIRDLFAGQTIELIGRYSAGAKGEITIAARVGNRPVHYEMNVQLPRKEERNGALGALWARRRIHELSGEMLSANPQDQRALEREITDLAVSFRLVSQYTAFVAVDESRIVGNGRPMKVLQPVPMPEDVSYQGVFGYHPAGEAVSVPGWGMTLQSTREGKILVREVDPQKVSARSGIRAGDVLVSIDNVKVHDLVHLEGLLLQSSGRVRLSLEPGGEVLLPAP